MMLQPLALRRATVALFVFMAIGLVLAEAQRLRAAPVTTNALCCQSSPKDAQAIRTSIGASLARTAEQSRGSHDDWRVQSIYQRGGWAYAFVKGYAAGGAAPLPVPSKVALAYLTAGGWQTVLPEDGAAYDQALAGLPDELIPAATRPLLSQPSSTAVAPLTSARAYFSGFSLPYPAEQSAYVFWHWYPALDFSIGAPGPGDTIRAAKPGTAVFVKGSSTVECGDPPPNWTCWMYANAIVIQSGPAEYAWYLHLAPNTIPAWLQEGASVPAGADIGQEGMTGWASLPHLHFMVSTWFACCTGSSDGRFPAWPLGTTWPVDFNEYPWSQIPYEATSQNGSSPAGENPPPSPPTAAPRPEAPLLADDAGAHAAGPAPTARSVVLPCSNPYAVQPGDFVIRIASNCNVNAAALVAANPGLNPNLIYVGQMLNLPSLGGRPDVQPTALPPATTGVAAAPSGHCSGTHVVAPGESLFEISAACGLAWQQMAAANGITSPYIIYAGQVLKYP